MGFVDELDLDLSIKCEECGSKINRKESIFINDSPYCSDCRKNLDRCARCGDLYKLDNLRSLNGNLYCIECWEEEFRQSIVKNYSWKPKKFRKFGKHPRIGAEIEIEIPTDKDQSKFAVKLYKWLQKYEIENLFYFKRDGSLSYGFEIVSMPISLSAWNTLPIYKFFKYIIKLGGRAHDTSTCGLHTHIERNYISRNSLRKVMIFMYKYKNILKEFTRRNRDRMERYAPISRWTVEDYQSKRHINNSTKYIAINAQHEFSYEFRIYKGTLKHESFMSCLEFTKLLPDYCKKTEPKDLDWNNFIKYTQTNSNYLFDYVNTNELLI